MKADRAKWRKANVARVAGSPLLRKRDVGPVTREKYQAELEMENVQYQSLVWSSFG